MPEQSSNHKVDARRSLLAAVGLSILGASVESATSQRDPSKLEFGDLLCRISINPLSQN